MDKFNIIVKIHKHRAGVYTFAEDYRNILTVFAAIILKTQIITYAMKKIKALLLFQSLCQTTKRMNLFRLGQFMKHA